MNQLILIATTAICCSYVQTKPELTRYCLIRLLCVCTTHTSKYHTHTNTFECIGNEREFPHMQSLITQFSCSHRSCIYTAPYTAYRTCTLCSSFVCVSQIIIMFKQKIEQINGCWNSYLIIWSAPGFLGFVWYSFCLFHFKQKIYRHKFCIYDSR